MLQDLRFGMKLLFKEKAFTATALLTLALCIGANTAIFTVLHAVVLAPLPYPEPDRLITMYNVYPGAGFPDHGANAIPDYLDRRAMPGLFDSVALFGRRRYDVGSQGSPESIQGLYVTPEWFRVLRAAPLLGRTFTNDEAAQGKDKVAVLSYGLWKDMFGRDPNVLGKDVRLTGVPYRIVGVMPENFGRLYREAKVWVPFAFSPEQTADDARHNNNWDMIARLNPGVTLAQVQPRIDALNRVNLDRFPKYRKLLEEARFATRVVPLKDELVRDVRPTLYLLQAAVIFVLLIGCVNVASLMLVRSSVRMKEWAIRFSLGAGRLRLARQLLTEGLALAALGGALGVCVGYAGVRLLSFLGTADLPRGHEIRLDTATLAFSAAVALSTGFIFGGLPLLHLFRRNLTDIFRQTGRTGTSERRAIWTRSALVVCEVSMAFILLMGAGLLTVSFARLLAVDPGFKPQHVLTANFALPRTRYVDDNRLRTFIDTLLVRLRGLPGVNSVSATTFLPFSGEANGNYLEIVGHTPAPGEKPPVPAWATVDPAYFRAMGIPALQGRTFAATDDANAPKVVIIDRFLADKYWPKGDAIGAKVLRDDKPWTIIGVVGSIRALDLAQHAQLGQVYFHYPQAPARNLHVVLRAVGDPTALTAALRREFLRADPELPLTDVKTMPERLAASVLHERTAMIVCLVFAALALLLSAIGIYGVLAYTVTWRTREFGIRMALGARAGDVLRMVAGHGLRLAGMGLALGIAGALLLTRLMTTLLFDVKPTDPIVFLLTASALAGVSLIAALIPSLRAVRIRPAVALRHE